MYNYVSVRYDEIKKVRRHIHNVLCGKPSFVHSIALSRNLSLRPNIRT